jgi:hypothetical protein
MHLYAFVAAVTTLDFDLSSPYTTAQKGLPIAKQRHDHQGTTVK